MNDPHTELQLLATEILDSEGQDLKSKMLGLKETLTTYSKSPFFMASLYDESILQHSELDFLIAYADQREMETAANVYETIRILKQWIQLTDNYLDKGDESLKAKGDEMMGFLVSKCDDDMLYVIKNVISMLWPTVDFQKRIQQDLTDGKTMRKNQARYLLERNALDAYLLYPVVFSDVLVNYTPNISSILYYHKILLDIEDQLIDIEEDIHEAQPNVFIMIAGLPLSDIKAGKIPVEQIIRGAAPAVQSIVESYDSCIRDIAVPQNFALIKAFCLLTSTELKSLLSDLPALLAHYHHHKSK